MATQLESTKDTKLRRYDHAPLSTMSYAPKTASCWTWPDNNRSAPLCLNQMKMAPQEAHSHGRVGNSSPIAKFETAQLQNSPSTNQAHYRPQRALVFPSAKEDESSSSVPENDLNCFTVNHQKQQYQNARPISLWGRLELRNWLPMFSHLRGREKPWTTRW